MAVLLSPLGRATTPSVHDPRRGRRPGPHGGRGVGRLGRGEPGGEDVRGPHPVVVPRARGRADPRGLGPSGARTDGSPRPGGDLGGVTAAATPASPGLGPSSVLSLRWGIWILGIPPRPSYGNDRMGTAHRAIRRHPLSEDWSSRKALVTGGASFIGSTIVDKLVARGAGTVRVVDDFSTGVRSNVQAQADAGAIELIEGDLRDPEIATASVRGIDTIFHLAADHGGRGYVDLHQYDCSTNFGLDASLFAAALGEGVDRITYASSGCIYPLYMQGDVDEIVYL